MWGIITELEFATASVGGMDTLSLLEVGLVGLIWLAVGLLAWMAARDLCLKSPSLWLQIAGPAGGVRLGEHSVHRPRDKGIRLAEVARGC
jgi:hypothetical protein